MTDFTGINNMSIQSNINETAAAAATPAKDYEKSSFVCWRERYIRFNSRSWMELIWFSTIIWEYKCSSLPWNYRELFLLLLLCVCVCPRVLRSSHTASHIFFILSNASVWLLNENLNEKRIHARTNNDDLLTQFRLLPLFGFRSRSLSLSVLFFITRLAHFLFFLNV